VEASFVREVVDRMLGVPDAASVAAVRILSRLLGRRVGGSTGTNFHGACRLIAEMHARGERGSVVTLLCDRGELYGHTYFSDAWVEREGLDLAPHERRLEAFLASGSWPQGA
jgi:cysteine synthase A